ncbi:hypothetical protein EVAR_102327_1 [Eumeta japonica]|uniref:Uncharacterized protein n=1 Tax=Eumeta variegata TaxID=151549 RepID=A0A4C1ZJ45_EUMVA|nr:hypothetical protein EVAR_102327_1 [Eumeta japonica]
MGARYSAGRGRRPAATMDGRTKEEVVRVTPRTLRHDTGLPDTVAILAAAHKWAYSAVVRSVVSKQDGTEFDPDYKRIGQPALDLNEIKSLAKYLAGHPKTSDSDVIWHWRQQSPADPNPELELSLKVLGPSSVV